MRYPINPWIAEEDVPRYSYLGSPDELADISEQLWTRELLEAQGLRVTNAQLSAIVFGPLDIEDAAQWLRGEIGYIEAKVETEQRMYRELDKLNDAIQFGIR